MGRGNETFGKKEVRAKKEKKRKEKEQKRLERKNNSRDNFDDMIAYVDEYGNITSTPPDVSQKKPINAEDIVIGVPRSEDSGQDNIHKGTIIFFDHSKGFGFIKDSATQHEIFMHVKSLLEPVEENSKVTFEVIRGVKGLNAINIRLDRD